MEFYDREIEIEQLKAIDKLSEKVAQFTVLMGRRRIGKTTLLKEAFSDKEMLYFFVSKKSIPMLCAEYQQQVEETLGITIHGQVSNFFQLLKEIFEYSKNHQVTIIIDEFQRLAEIEPSCISEIQNVWDAYQQYAHIHLIACGSIYSMMHKLFEDSKEPLFGRKTARLDLKPFSVGSLKKILADHNPNYTSEDLLMLYALTGGVAKYVAHLMDTGNTTKEKMLNSVCSATSIFLEEGTELLIGEFGKQYQVYFSILQLVASGMTSQSEIDSIIGKNTGRYLKTLGEEYSFLDKKRPMWAKNTSLGVKYFINDCFLNFWFRFIESNRSIIELGKYNLLREYIQQNWEQYSGYVLEKYFRQLYSEMPRVTQVSHWWDKKGENEIDLIAIEAMDKRAIIGEVKRNIKRYNPNLLNEKYQNIKSHLRGYKVELKCLSMNDM